MATRPMTNSERRLDALGVLLTGAADDCNLAAFAAALIGTASLAGPQDLAAGVATVLAERHRVRMLAPAVFPETAVGVLPAVLTQMNIDRQLAEVTQTLARDGVPALALKGNATGHLDYPQVGQREVGDIDLLVKPADVGGAIASIERLGGRLACTHPFRDPRFFHSETIVLPSGIEVDLHHRLSQPSLPPRSCWERPDSFDIAGVTIGAMPRHWRFVHAVVHQMMNPPPSFRALNGLVDMAVLWRHGVDLAAASAAADEIAMGEVFRRGVARLTDVLGEPRPVLVGSSRLTERWFAAAVDGTEPTAGYVSLAANLSVQPPWHWPAMCAGLLWPSRAYRELIGRTWQAQVRHVVREGLGLNSGA